MEQEFYDAERRRIEEGFYRNGDLGVLNVFGDFQTRELMFESYLNPGFLVSLTLPVAQTLQKIDNPTAYIVDLTLRIDFIRKKLGKPAITTIRFNDGESFRRFYKKK